MAQIRQVVDHPEQRHPVAQIRQVVDLQEKRHPAAQIRSAADLSGLRDSAFTPALPPSKYGARRLDCSYPTDGLYCQKMP